MGTHWETGKNEKKIHSTPQNLKGIEARHFGPSHWLKGKQISPHPLPSPIKVAWKVQCPRGHWRVHSPTKCSLKEKPPLQPGTNDFIIKFNYTLRFIHCKEIKKQNK
jgi:hypothetical protein